MHVSKRAAGTGREKAARYADDVRITSKLIVKDIGNNPVMLFKHG